MKISNISSVSEGADGKGKIRFHVTLGKGPSARSLVIDKDVEPAQYEVQKLKPVPIDNFLNNAFMFHNKIVRVEGRWEVGEEELLIRVKHFILKQERDFDKAAKEVEAFERMTEAETARRENIPDSVKLFVWQRDQGKCVKCGSKEKLEFDHIIPFAMGGSNTERNLQLLCEAYNNTYTVLTQ